MAALAFLDLSFKVTYLPYYSTTGIWKTCCSRDKTMLLKLHPMPGKLCQTDYFPKQMQQVAKYLQWSLTQFWWTIHLKTWGNSYAFPRIPYVKIKSSALKLQFSLSNPLWVPFLKIYIRSQVTNQKLHCQNWPYKKKHMPSALKPICLEHTLSHLQKVLNWNCWSVARDTPEIFKDWSQKTRNQGIITGKIGIETSSRSTYWGRLTSCLHSFIAFVHSSLQAILNIEETGGGFRDALLHDALVLASPGCPFATNNLESN